MNNPKISEVYTLKERLLSFLSGVILGSLIGFPFIALAINLLILYIYYYYVVTFFLLFTLIAWVILIDVFYYNTLMNYKLHPGFNIKDCVLKHSLITSALILLLGGILIIFIIPNYI